MASSGTPWGGDERAALIADTAIMLLANHGLDAVTPQTVDKEAGLPQGTTAGYAPGRYDLLKSTVSRLATREAMALTPPGGTGPPETLDGLVEATAQALRHLLTKERELALARYELALEATREPELRASYDQAGAFSFREPLIAQLSQAGSPDPERHAQSTLAWIEGVLFTCIAGTHHAVPPSLDELRSSCHELLAGMLYVAH
ncbi:TetR/AcrR family transcriptional regulator [Streptomyces sp. NPDC005438]|uniref:TetR/AcrR family transcriptional regulator n=1 Tax=Streptomyces sp. NPDC005438 TaxID=3156880 RepID=UPI00339F23CD